MGEQRPFLPAVVDPEVAFYWSLELGVAMERLAAGRSDRLRRKMLRSRELVREAARQWFEAKHVDRDLGGVVEPVETVTVAEAAAVLGVTAQYVRRLCQRGIDGGGLVAHQQGRVWVIEAWSVHAYRAERGQAETA